jgi:hypothetical protein
MADNLVVNVRQITQYPPAPTANPTDALLLQQGGLGGPYVQVTPAAFMAALTTSNITFGGLTLAGPIVWGKAALQGSAAGLAFSWNGTPVATVDASGSAFFNGNITAKGRVTAQDPINPSDLATARYVTDNTVWTFNCRRGNVQLVWSDLLAAGAAPIRSPQFMDTPTAPAIGDVDQCDGQIATTEFVQRVSNKSINDVLAGHPFVWTWNGRGGDVCLSLDDVTRALFSGRPVSPTPAPGNFSDRIATTKFVGRGITESADDTLATVQRWLKQGASVYVGRNPPRAPQPGRLWYDTQSSTLFMWNGNRWIQSGGVASVQIQDTPPLIADSGDLWWNTSDGNLYVYYINPATAVEAWVIANLGGGGGGGIGPPGPPGPPGTSLVLTGETTGMPPLPGAPGDAYLDTSVTPNTVWLWVPDTPGLWVNIGAIVGPPGADGTAHVGPAPPSTFVQGSTWWDDANDLLMVYDGAAWVNSGFPDAPSDGTLYARRNGAWLHVVDDGTY